MNIDIDIDIIERAVGNTDELIQQRRRWLKENKKQQMPDDHLHLLLRDRSAFFKIMCEI